ncbi:hypothetical protein B7R22_18460 [Subtercola boreus]|uniref:Integrase catalytic domain-containing protein n=1 Tax=Subtercola boreus TaxID=120213 RepID=A0A3E0VPM6_9MICO|nr:hypothetical protein B7R22_18460 [Subtercola boreus]
MMLATPRSWKRIAGRRAAGLHSPSRWRTTASRIPRELGATPSTGTVGDSYDNALAEAVNALYKTELIRQRGPWRTVEQVELATLEW